MAWFAVSLIVPGGQHTPSLSTATARLAMTLPRGSFAFAWRSAWPSDSLHARTSCGCALWACQARTTTPVSLRFLGRPAYSAGRWPVRPRPCSAILPSPFGRGDTGHWLLVLAFVAALVLAALGRPAPTGKRLWAIGTPGPFGTSEPASSFVRATSGGKRSRRSSPTPIIHS